MTDAIRGYWAAVPSPVDGSGRLDEVLFAQHARGLLQVGLDGVVAFGTTGEGPSFSVAERLSGVEALLRAGIPAERIGLGCGSAALTDITLLASAALGLGLTHMLVLPPFFFRDATEAGIEDAFAAFLDRVHDDRLRLTLYHIPQVSGLPVPPQAAARLRQRYGSVVAGVKDSSGDFSHFRAFRRAAPELAVTVGNEPDIGRALAEGGAGTICGLANVAPRLIGAIFAGAPDDAAVRSLARFFEGRPFVPTVKAVLAAQSGIASWGSVRPPLRSVEPSEGDRIAAAMRELELGEAA